MYSDIEREDAALHAAKNKLCSMLEGLGAEERWTLLTFLLEVTKG